MEGTISTNFNETNGALVASQAIGDPNHNAGVGIFASSNLFSGPINTGAFANYSRNKHTLSVLNSLTPGFGSSLVGSGSINLYQDPVHKVDASVSHGVVRFKDGFKFNNTGAGLNYSHSDGHSVGVVVSQIPQIDATTGGVHGTLNLWKSEDQLNRLDMSTGASRTFGGWFDTQNNSSFSLNFSSKF